jgi:hypothetical protein
MSPFQGFGDQVNGQGCQQSASAEGHQKSDGSLTGPPN